MKRDLEKINETLKEIQLGQGVITKFPSNKICSVGP